MTPDQLRPYQLRGVDHILDHPNAMLWEDVGLGKTIQTLTSFVELQAGLQVGAMLVLANLRIIQAVWRQEAAKWSHTRHLRFSLIHGTPAQREAALNREADIYLCNYDNLSWLATHITHKWLRKKRYPPFSMVVYDEITRLKNPSSKRMKAWKPILPYFNRRVGMTGEPAANGYKDLFGQYLAVDGGQRLGTSVGAYRDAFLQPVGYGGYDWVATKTGREQIHRRVADITLELSAKDYLDLPPLMNNIVWVDLPPDVRATYDAMEKDFLAVLDSGATIEAPNAAALLTKLAQIASGATYLQPNGPWEEVHKAKLEALEDLVEESAGRPLLLGYTFRHEQARIAREWPSGASFLSSDLGEREIQETLRKWERDEVALLCGHPASMGHGLNLQGSSARALVWFSLPWSLELYNQMVGRMFGGLRRQGASVVHHILARGTVDELIYGVLQSKSMTQDGLKLAVKQYREARGR